MLAIKCVQPGVLSVIRFPQSQGGNPLIDRDSLVSGKKAYVHTAHTLMPLIHSAMTREETSFSCKVMLKTHSLLQLNKIIEPMLKGKQHKLF